MIQINSFMEDRHGEQWKRGVAGSGIQDAIDNRYDQEDDKAFR